jgi:hypothetical protein
LPKSRISRWRLNSFASRPDVRFGSLADICEQVSHVRFTPEADIRFVVIADAAEAGANLARALSPFLTFPVCNFI